jgi:tetratricopeptide (TPR) repeat protein
LREIVELCGRLPLALRVAAARLRAHRSWTARHLIDRLSDRRQRLAELEAGQRSVVAALDLSYQHLTAAQQRAYRLIGLHPGSDLDLHATAALLDGDLPGTRRVLDQLLDTHLLDEPTPDRYQFHDLTREHAASIATRDESGAPRHAALARLFTHYAYTAAVAMDAAYPFEKERRPQPPDSTHPVPDVHTADLATAWLDAELPNLLAAAGYTAEHDSLDYPTRFSAILDLHLMSRSRTSDAETLQRLALSAARTTGDAVAEVNASTRLGLIHRFAGQYPQAESHFRMGLQLARTHGYFHGEMDALNGLGQVQRLRSEFSEAADSFNRALDIAERVDYPSGELDALVGIGHLYSACEDDELAAKYLGQTLALARDTGHRYYELDALVGLGWNQLGYDAHDQAAEYFGLALDIARAVGHRIRELTSLIGLAAVHHRQGRHAAAAGIYEDVLAQARQISNANWTFEALQGLGRTQLSLCRPDEALAYHQQALAVADEIDQPSDSARAHDGIAHAQKARHEPDRARHHWHKALDILTELGIGHTADWEASATAIRGHLATYDGQPHAPGNQASAPMSER